MKISIITPYYYGKKYIGKLFENIYRVSDSSPYLIEWIIVNDSPKEEIEIPDKRTKQLEVKIVKNQKNLGIQKTRIVGFNESSGEYILFLDQDDCLNENLPNILEEHYISNIDVFLFNGIDEIISKKVMIYRNKYHGRLATKLSTYINNRNFIVSPGQCIIKKDSIPEQWLLNKLEVNGADDYYLWILLLNDRKKIKYVNEVGYIHVDTGENLSNNIENMYHSELCMLEKLKNHLSSKDYKKLTNNINFRHKYKYVSKREAFIHPILFIKNTYYSIIGKVAIYKIKRIGDKSVINNMSNE